MSTFLTRFYIQNLYDKEVLYKEKCLKLMDNILLFNWLFQVIKYCLIQDR